MKATFFLRALVLGTIFILAACTVGSPEGELPETGATEPAAAETQAAGSTPTETLAPPNVTPTAPPGTQDAGVGTPSGGEALTPTAPAGSASGGASEFIQRLEASGAQVESAPGLDSSVFPVRPEVILVNGESVQVYEFPDEVSQQAAADTISANGYTVGTIAVDWIAQPYFWSSGRLIVLYVGEDQATVELLSSQLGAPLTGPQAGSGAVTPGAGGELPAAAVLEAQRWLAGQLGMDISDLTIVSAEQADWSDACLGLGGPAESCAQVITTGWRVVLEADGQTYTLRTNETGSQVRMEQGITNLAFGMFRVFGLI